VVQRDFNKEAATWDDNPGRVKAANDIADTLLKEVRLTPEMDVLDFGCGTGLITMRLSPFVLSVTGADSSTRMLDMLRAKIDKGHIRNVEVRHLDPEGWDLPGNRYDLVVAVMTLHHVEKIEPFLERLSGVLAPGGCLCVAELDPDDGQFHDDNTGVFHFGFDREALRAVFSRLELSDIRIFTAAEIVKPVQDGALRAFTVFGATGCKRKE